MAFIFLILNFGISWMNARGAGRIWSESKELGGMLRVHAIVGYGMAIAGFTMVYGSILIMLLPYILPMIIHDIDPETLFAVQQLSNDLLYILIVTFVVPTGFFVWFTNFVSFWRRRSLAEGLRLAWNTYAQIRNTVSVARHAPDVLRRITNAFFGGRRRNSGKGAIILMAIFVIILAAIGGWLTASAIMHKADKDYDLLEGLTCQGTPDEELFK